MLANRVLQSVCWLRLAAPVLHTQYSMYCTVARYLVTQARFAKESRLSSTCYGSRVSGIAVISGDVLLSQQRSTLVWQLVTGPVRIGMDPQHTAQGRNSSQVQVIQPSSNSMRNQ